MKRLLLIGLLRGIALLPWRGIQALGSLLGWLILHVPNRQRRDILINIRLCFPDLSEQEQMALRRRTVMQFACTIVELSALWVWPVHRVLGLIKQVSGVEFLQREPGEGLIFLTPHLGAWELAGLYMGKTDAITSMYRPQRHVDDFILAARSRSGAHLVPDDRKGVKQLLRAVKNGQAIGLLPDQVTRDESGSVFAPFFGVPAPTMLLVAGLARRTDARVVFVATERLPRGQGFHIHILPAAEAIADPDDDKAARALNQGVEELISLFPEQYQWTYRRFRRRPDNGPSPYRGPSI